MKSISVTRVAVSRMGRIDEDSEESAVVVGARAGDEGEKGQCASKDKAETSPLLPKGNGADPDEKNGVVVDNTDSGRYLMPWAFQNLSSRFVPSPFDESRDEEDERNLENEEDVLVLARKIQQARRNRRRYLDALETQRERFPAVTDSQRVPPPGVCSPSIPLEVSAIYPPPPPPADSGKEVNSSPQTDTACISPSDSQDHHKRVGSFVPPEHGPSAPQALDVPPETTGAYEGVRNPYHKYLLSVRPPRTRKPRQNPSHHRQKHRSLRRRIFLLLTEPQTSILSALFFAFLIIMIAVSNIVMILQTMDAWQYTPDECVFCGGDKYYGMGGDSVYNQGTDGVRADVDLPCVCPPLPTPEIVAIEDWIIFFFTIEWTLRVICFAPPKTSENQNHRYQFLQWLSFLREPTTILDALAIFPYYLERLDKSNSLLSLRLLRLFRVFQLLRLGKYNVTFLCLINVLVKAFLSINLLIVVLLFGAAFFGSMIYWLEKGEWRYTTQTEPPSFAYVRPSADGFSEELSPFASIPSAFWWFIVTVTTVGYGDTYPTSVCGKFVAAAAMLLGLLVIAFPVSVFSDLWSKELHSAGALSGLEVESENDPNGVDTNKSENSNDVLTTILQRLDRMEETQAKLLAMLQDDKAS